MDRRIFVAAIIAVAVIGIAGFAAWKVSTRTSGGPQTAAPGESDIVGTSAGYDTKGTVSPNTRVPDASANVAEDVAKPQSVAIAAPGSKVSVRTFDIKLEDNEVDTPNIILYAGDIARITITAVDKAYDFAQPDYGLRFNLKAGEKKTFENQFTNPGKYLFYCESCGGPENGPQGYFLVVPQQ